MPLASNFGHYSFLLTCRNWPQHCAAVGSVGSRECLDSRCLRRYWLRSEPWNCCQSRSSQIVPHRQRRRHCQFQTSRFVLKTHTKRSSYVKRAALEGEERGSECNFIIKAKWPDTRYEHLRVPDKLRFGGLRRDILICWIMSSLLSWLRSRLELCVFMDGFKLVVSLWAEIALWLYSEYVAGCRSV